jgi:uncharacterized protein (DUF58 family)
VFKVWYRFYRLASWFKHWTWRRFTKTGLAVSWATLAAGLMGPDTESNLAYQGFTVLLSLLLFALVFSWFFRVRVGVRRVAPRFGTVGLPLKYQVLVQNRTRSLQKGLTVLDELADPRPAFHDWLAVKRAEDRRLRSFRFNPGRRAHPFTAARIQEAPVPATPAGEETAAQVEVTPLRRGLLRFEAVTVARPDPFGLYRGCARLALTDSILVLPKRYPLPSIALPGSFRYQQGGVAMASNVGQSDEFVSLRDYRRGDPVRHIHWRSWARAGRPVVKEFEDEFFVRHALVLDTFTEDPLNEAFEEAVSVAASFASTIQTQESLLDLLFVGPESYCFTAGRGLAHADQMMEILASVRTCGGKSFASLEHLVLTHARALSGCICVLLDWDEPRQRFVRKLREFDLPVLVLVVLEPGRATALEPGPMAGHPEQFHVLQCGQVERGLARLV